MIRLSQLTLLAVIASVPTIAFAGGFYTGRFGNQHGHAASQHVVSTYYNPAGIASLRGNHLYLEGIAALRIAEYDRDAAGIDDLGGATPNDAQAANAGEASLNNLLVSPFLGFTTDLGTQNFTLGFAGYVPFGGQASWDQNTAFEGNETYPGAVDGTQRWANIEGSQRTIYLTTAAAWRIPKANVSIGFGFNVIHNTVHTIRARTATGRDDLVASGGQTLEGRSLADTSGWTYSISGGIQWEPTEKLLLAASYQSIPGFGKTRQEGTLTNKFGNASAVPTPIWLEQELPDIFRVAAAYRLPKWELRVQGDLQRWGSFENQCLMNLNVIDRNCALNADGSVDRENGGAGVTVVLPRDWEDTYSIFLGAEYKGFENLSVYGGILYDSNAIPDETLGPALMDMDKFNVQGGISSQLSDKLILNVALNGVFYADRTTEPREVAPLAPSRNPDGAGDYSQFIAYLTVGLGYAF